jgi:pilus assembly protein CpaB
MASVEARVGPLVPVVVARDDLQTDEELSAPHLAVRRVPERFVPRDSLASVDDAVGLRASVPVAAGSYLTAGQIRGAGSGAERGPLRRSERALDVAVPQSAALGESAAPAGRVDVLVTTEARDGRGRTFLALEDVDLLGLRPGDALDDAAAADRRDSRADESATAVATLRVTLRQAVYLTAAQNFAREVRLLPRPPNDRRREGRAVVPEDQL